MLSAGLASPATLTLARSEPLGLPRAVIVMVAIGTGARTSIESQIKSAGSNLVMVNAGSGGFGPVRQGQGAVTTLVAADAEAIRDQVAGIRFLTPIIVPLLLAMAIAKFVLVVMFFMHLRYDSKALTFLFAGPLVIATLLAVALMALVGGFIALNR